MKNKNITPLVDDDMRFINTLKEQINTVAGKEFLSKIEYKMQYEPAPANDLLLSEYDNNEGIYLVRCYDHEFILGCHVGEKYEEEFYAMTFSEAMKTNLKTCKFINDDVTMIEWLTNRDFKGMRYNHNYDLM